MTIAAILSRYLPSDCDLLPGLTNMKVKYENIEQ